jgi:hypothetical protein
MPDLHHSVDQHSRLRVSLNNRTFREDIVDATTSYQGYALPGTATSAAAWQITRSTKDGSGNVTAVLFADGNDLYDNVWDNRASLSYS